MATSLSFLPFGKIKPYEKRNEKEKMAVVDFYFRWLYFYPRGFHCDPSYYNPREIEATIRGDVA